MERSPRGASRARVLVLVGPKGSGKTTLGRMLERELGACFVEVEAIAKALLSRLGGTVDEHYAERALEAIEQAVAEAAAEHALVVFETTGASSHSSRFLARIAAAHDVRFVRVRASWPTCEARMATRDSSRQVSVPKELVREMHDRTEALTLPWHLELDNEHGLSCEELVSAIGRVL